MTTAARRHRLAMLYRLVPQTEAIVCRFGDDVPSDAARKRELFEEAKAALSEYIGRFAKDEHLAHLCFSTKRFVREAESYQAVAQEIADILGLKVVLVPRVTTNRPTPSA